MYETMYQGTKSHSERLKEIKSFRLPSSSRDEAILKFYELIDTPVSLGLYLRYKYSLFTDLVSIDISPHDYNHAEKFQLDYAAVSLLRKNRFLKTDFKLKEQAMDSFIRSEAVCRTVNERLTPYLPENRSFFNDLDPARLALIERIRGKIARMLGRFDIDELLDKCRWGPGVTLLVKGKDTSPSRKFMVENNSTREMYDLFGACLTAAYPKWECLREPVFVAGNAVITVPKNAKTDRTIAIEPGLNSWVQLGLGGLLRRRLRRAGYDLNSDQKNQYLARKGSIDDSIATVDFKAASDTITNAVVELLLPHEWFQCLSATRSEYYTIGGVTSRYEKFSSMGCGFTFELESLIFIAIAESICGRDIDRLSIFGDDLIIPCEYYREVVEACTFFGFTVNQEKSFSSGPFRESCGSYYFNGVDVKPIFLKDGLLFVTDLYKFANSLTKLAHRFGLTTYRDARFRPLWNYVTHLVPQHLRCYGPLMGGDSNINVCFEDAVVKRANNQLEGFLYSGLICVTVTKKDDSLGLLLARLHKSSSTDGGNAVPLRGRTRLKLKKRMLCHQWYTFGPWL